MTITRKTHNLYNDILIVTGVEVHKRYMYNWHFMESGVSKWLNFCNCQKYCVFIAIGPWFIVDAKVHFLSYFSFPFYGLSGLVLSDFGVLKLRCKMSIGYESIKCTHAVPDGLLRGHKSTTFKHKTNDIPPSLQLPTYNWRSAGTWVTVNLLMGDRGVTDSLHMNHSLIQ